MVALCLYKVQAESMQLEVFVVGNLPNGINLQLTMTGDGWNPTNQNSADL